MESKDDLFRSIYNRYMPLLRWIANQKGIPYDEIDDLVQEAFAEFYGHYPLTWPEHKIRSALVKTMRNLCIDYKRRCHTRLQVCMDPSQMQMQEQGMVMNKGSSRDVLSIVTEHEEYQEVLDALCSMKADWALVFVLYIIQGRPMKDVAKIIGISDAACRTRLMRGRKYLREKLGEEITILANESTAELTHPPGTSVDSEVPGNT